MRNLGRTETEGVTSFVILSSRPLLAVGHYTEDREELLVGPRLPG